ncbi:hypothetical protein HDU93_002064 [Gonapodya sp. JEL0774]|nr:hypothetical protein HDU93_002064 [Gonapodya sp. JEL0774]
MPAIASGSSDIVHPRPHRVSLGHPHGSVRFAEKSAVVNVPRDQVLVKEIEEQMHHGSPHGPGTGKGKNVVGVERPRSTDPVLREIGGVTGADRDAGGDDGETGDAEEGRMARYASDLSVKEIGMLEKRLSRTEDQME